MRYPFRVLPSLVLAALSVSAPARTEPVPAPGKWGRVVTGRLANGVRYAILPRRAKEPGVGVLMRNEGGFIAERRPGERGLAHLIEHVVFHSPTTAAPDDLDHFTRLGLQVSLPAPHVATTSWRESNYFVSTKTRDPAEVDTMLGLFREAAGEMTLRADAVDRERESVMREMADKRLGNAVYADYIAAVAPGSPTDAIDGQNSDDVPTAGIETIRGLYHRLYRPRNMMLVVVGDVDPRLARAAIVRRFGGWRGIGPDPVRAAYPQFAAGRIAPISFSARSDGRRSAMATMAARNPPVPRTRGARLKAAFMDLLITRLVDDRSSVSRPADGPNKAGLFVEHGEQGHRLMILWADFAEGGWRPAVAGLRATLCDLRVAGFSETAVANAGRGVIGDLEARTRSMPDVPNVEIAKDLSHAVADGSALIPPDELLRYARRTLPGLDAGDANDWWRRHWRPGSEHLRVEAPELARERAPLAAIRAVADAAVVPPACRVRR